MTEENPETRGGCAPKVLNSWRAFWSTINIGHRIHPSEPLSAKDCEYIIFDPKIKMRIIHVRPENPRKSLQLLPEPTKRNSLSEEYWFTRNKPLKPESCNCPFQRSLRYSARFSFIANQPSSQSNVKRESMLSIEAPPTKIKNVDTFIERLIEETFLEAFQEYYYRKCKDIKGIVNLGYEVTEEDDIVVTLRRKPKPNKREKTNLSSKNGGDTPSRKNHCTHRSKPQKPLIFMFHGIGATADIWTILITNLASKGYEVIAPDMLGHGYSSAPDRANCYSFKNLLLHAITVFDYFMGEDDKRKCILIGHSYGCSIITALYPHRASQVSQLILISGGGPTPLAPPAKVDEISPYGCVHNLFYPLLFCGVKRSLFYSSRGKHFSSCTEDTGVPEYVVDFLIKGQYWPEGDAAFHRRIMVPTLLVHGLQDTKITLVQECEMERTIPRAFLEIIPNSGHLSMLDAPEHLTHMILCFLDVWN